MSAPALPDGPDKPDAVKPDPRKPDLGNNAFPGRFDLTIAAGEWPPRSHLLAMMDRCLAAAASEVETVLPPDSEVSLVFTDDTAMRGYNRAFRGIDRPTNVLSFPAVNIDATPTMLGDIVLAAETVSREAALENMPLDDHISHLVIHGFLHLLGLDHDRDDEADAMEDAERRALARLGISDPYVEIIGD